VKKIDLSSKDIFSGDISRGSSPEGREIFVDRDHVRNTPLEEDFCQFWDPLGFKRNS